MSMEGDYSTVDILSQLETGDSPLDEFSKPFTSAVSLDDEETVKGLEDPRLKERMSEARKEYVKKETRKEITKQELEELKKVIGKRNVNVTSTNAELRSVRASIMDLKGDALIAKRDINSVIETYNPDKLSKALNKITSIFDELEKMESSMKTMIDKSDVSRGEMDHAVSVLLKIAENVAVDGESQE